jgi:hypothetical protein
LVRSKRKESVQRRTKQRRWSIVARRQDAGGAVESKESDPMCPGGRMQEGPWKAKHSNLHCDEAAKRRKERLNGRRLTSSRLIGSADGNTWEGWLVTPQKCRAAPEDGEGLVLVGVKVRCHGCRGREE